MDKQLTAPILPDAKTPTQPTPLAIDRGDVLFALFALAAGFYYLDFLFTDVQVGAGLTLFALIFCGAAGFYLHKSGCRQTKTSSFYLGVILVSALQFVWSANDFLKMWNFILLHLAVVYWIAVTASTRVKNTLSVYGIGDLCNQLITIPFGNFASGPSVLRKATTQHKQGQAIFSAILGMVAFIPVLAIVLLLLVQADSLFESWVNWLFSAFSQNTLSHFWKFICGLPIACFLFGLLYGNRYQRKTALITVTSIEKTASHLRLLPQIGVYSALTMLNGLYLIFLSSQTVYLFSAFQGKLWQGLSYADYARRGFFELCLIAAINMVVMAGAYLLIQRNTDNSWPFGLKIQSVALSAATLCLIATAQSKLVMYINYYGLTRLRLYAAWFIAVLFLIFIIIVVRQFRVFNAARFITLSVTVAFLLLCYGNVDAGIASYNIERYQQGTLACLDLEELSQLSVEAAPAIDQLSRLTTDQRLKAQLDQLLLEKKSQAPITFRSFNYPQYWVDHLKQ